MSATATNILNWSDNWSFVPGPPSLLTAGPDVLFELDGLSENSLGAASRWSSGSPVGDDLAPEEAELRDLLIGLGALVPAVKELVDIQIVGSPGRRIVDALNYRGFTAQGSEHKASLSLVLRTEATWPAAPIGVHLGVDLTHHHTLVLGPLVVPGATSCLMCLQRQTGRRWGADGVPAEPRITRWPEVSAELIGIQIELAKRGESPLVNATIAWDLADGTAVREDLLRAPDCGGLCRSPIADSLDLPWLTA